MTLVAEQANIVSATPTTSDEFVELARRTWQFLRDNSIERATPHTQYPLEWRGSLVSHLRRDVLTEFSYPTLRKLTKDLYEFLRDTGHARCVSSASGNGSREPLWAVSRVWRENEICVKQMTTHYVTPKPTPGLPLKAKTPAPVQPQKQRGWATHMVRTTLASGQWMTVSDIAAQTGISKQAVHAAITGLRQNRVSEIETRLVEQSRSDNSRFEHRLVGNAPRPAAPDQVRAANGLAEAPRPITSPLETAEQRIARIVHDAIAAEGIRESEELTEAKAEIARLKAAIAALTL